MSKNSTFRVTCEHCPSTFTSKADLKRHTTPKISCPGFYCSSKFHRNNHKVFREHITERHPILPLKECKAYFKSLSAVTKPIEKLCCLEVESPSLEQPKSSSALNAASMTKVNDLYPCNSSSSHSPGTLSIISEPSNVPTILPSQIDGIGAADPAPSQQSNPTSTSTDKAGQVVLAIWDDIQQSHIIGYNPVLSNYVGFALKHFDLWLEYLDDDPFANAYACFLVDIQDDAQKGYIMINDFTFVVYMSFTAKHTVLWWVYINGDQPFIF
ncbi:MAG: hypothetical protein M1834_003211 [Cirrosporium novae-zelandiae]|nr:MAG: hypothetical protein M1834_003211 [Cirrosporium novae-zelandiae]